MVKLLTVLTSRNSSLKYRQLNNRFCIVSTLTVGPARLVVLIVHADRRTFQPGHFEEPLHFLHRSRDILGPIVIGAPAAHALVTIAQRVRLGL